MHIFFGPDVTEAKLPPSLQSLTTSLLSNDYPDLDSFSVDFDSLAKLADLPNLTKLTLKEWQPIRHLSDLLPTWSTSVETLRIEGDGVDEGSDTEFIAVVCPALKHLELKSTLKPMEPSSFDLECYPSSLESISLTVDDRVSYDGCSQIQRFTHLRSLTLGDGCYSSLLPSTLQFLPLLVDITLGRGEMHPIRWQPLVSGPNRLRHLKSLRLDVAACRRGRTIRKPSTAGFSAQVELDRHPVDMIDWELPNEIEHNDNLDEFDARETRKLVKLAQENGIQVKGTILEVLRDITDYWIEKYNRAVVRLHLAPGDTDLVSIQESAWDEGGIVLPACIFRPRDRNVVEIDLPKRNWFVLCIRDSGGMRQREELEDWEDY
ncbi:hypothetical protein JCM5353_006951 [Sporobolomyces roseus]